ncbi:sulfatase-like hydrolase/transferase [Paraburkholderia tropica]|uniref:sulfatase-like hydrolase/transferase n=1 Tax=Paraburkholderia tropica TaxID=92647 RepID=UPI002AB6681F|nr:sulfatase-like hydrolase/transferase [Paraburkholderia tropica]
MKERDTNDNIGKPGTINNPTRRTFLRTAGAAAAALSTGASIAGTPDGNTAGNLISKKAGTVVVKAPEKAPSGFNILFVIADQERYFSRWPFKVPGRQRLLDSGVSFNNHQIASCVCSPSRSTIYTGYHVQETGVFDNSESLWQPDLSIEIDTIAHRMERVGYYSAYMGKWHMSKKLNATFDPILSNPVQYADAMAKYGFHDYYGLGDSIGYTLGGYLYDDFVTSGAINWMKMKGASLNREGRQWFLAVNLVNPHDAMFLDPRTNQPRGAMTKRGIVPTATPPRNDLYSASWNIPLPKTRTQPFDAVGRPRAHLEYMSANSDLVGGWAKSDAEWQTVQDYYFNCIRDCDTQVKRLLEALDALELTRNTIVVMTSDHGELGGAHQMWNKGACTYREQNHVPFIVSHPAYPGGKQCKALTSHLDVAPTLLGLTGLPDERLASEMKGLRGRSMIDALSEPQRAPVDMIRPAALFNYHMLSSVDAHWYAEELKTILNPNTAREEKLKRASAIQPDLSSRGAIRSVFDGRYRFSRYFSLLDYNTPHSAAELFSHNDVELYDLVADPDEINNLAVDRVGNNDLIMTMNTKLNDMMSSEVPYDDGRELPIRDGKVIFPMS